VQLPGDYGGPSRRQFLARAAVACLLGVARTNPFSPPEALSTSSPFLRGLIDPRAVSTVRTNARLVAITFDDGPDPAFTPQVLSILADLKVTATFFCIGQNAARHPDLVADIARAGHTVANHTLDHPILDALSASDVEREIAGGHRVLGDLGVDADGLFRPPKGRTSLAVAQTTKALHARSIFWSDCLEHHFSTDQDDPARGVVRDARPGSIILCHDGGHLDGPNPQQIDRSRTVAALAGLVEGLLSKDLRPVTVPQLMAARRNR
jgi:peptidoglycan/xylan/chitin deacetylase (PgdA/CDA1 family)